MLRDRARELLPIIQAFADGKPIEYKNVGNWKLATGPDWSNDIQYRIKPELKLVPFTFEDELLGRKIIYSDGTRAMITAQKKDGVYIGGSLNLTSYSSLISTTKFEDGSPCGKYINE